MNRVLMLYRKSWDENPVILREIQVLKKSGYDVTLKCWNRRRKVVGYLKLLSGEEYDYIHSHDIHTLPAGVFLSKKMGAKLIYDCHDRYDLTTHGLLSRLLYYSDKILSKYADSIIVPCDYYRQFYPPDKTHVIYNVPEVEFGNIKRVEDGELTISFFGTVRSVIPFFHLFEISESLGFKVLVVTKDVDKLKTDNPNVTVKPPVSYEELKKLYSITDAVFAVYPKNHPAVKYSIPMKVFEAMAVGVPVITTANTHAGRFVEESEIGVTVEYGNKESMKEAISVLMDENMRKCYGNNGKKLFLEKYNWNIMEKEFLSIYR